MKFTATLSRLISSVICGVFLLDGLVQAAPLRVAYSAISGAMSSLWTSQYPDRHHGELSYADRLPRDRLTLAEVLGGAGIPTAGFVANAAPYGSGILAKGPDAYARYEYREAPQEMVERVRKMERACLELDVPLAAAALQFSLRDPRVVSTIVGISRPERVGQTLELATHPIPEELWERLDSFADPGG